MASDENSLDRMPSLLWDLARTLMRSQIAGHQASRMILERGGRQDVHDPGGNHHEDGPDMIDCLANSPLTR